jgi:hypothetical protein
MVSEGIVPIIVVIDPNNPTPGSQVQVTVTMDGAAKQSQAVAITGSPSSFFSQLPTSVNVDVGESAVTFAASVAATASGNGSVTASCNGGQATGGCVATQG